jgi:hypothetical protein
MKSRFLTITVAVASMFIAQQAVSAKSHTGSAAKSNATSKKHHKKHSKTAGMSTATPAAKAALATS